MDNHWPASPLNSNDDRFIIIGVVLYSREPKYGTFRNARYRVHCLGDQWPVEGGKLIVVKPVEGKSAAGPKHGISQNHIEAGKDSPWVCLRIRNCASYQSIEVLSVT